MAGQRILLIVALIVSLVVPVVCTAGAEGNVGQFEGVVCVDVQGAVIFVDAGLADIRVGIDEVVLSISPAQGNAEVLMTPARSIADGYRTATPF